MTIRLGVVMDPIQSIHYKKDTTLAMLWEAQKRKWDIFYFEQKDLFLRDGVPFGDAKRLVVAHDPSAWFEFQGDIQLLLSELDVMLMRKDPPFNEEYIYTTYILEAAERQSVFVVNKPQALRDCNEKFFATQFPNCTPPTLVTQSIEKLHAFKDEYKDIICKPLNGMGGASVFHVREEDANASVIFETLTRGGTLYTMAQTFIPEIKSGDKRIIMINGEPFPHALARIPQGNDWRGNLAAGAKGVAQVLSERDRFICDQVGPELRKRGLYFVGLDVIGDYLTEINVTSPTCVRELDTATDSIICESLMDFIEKRSRKP
jgi:glutathione synthase